jgi:hypothetical protein
VPQQQARIDRKALPHELLVDATLEARAATAAAHPYDLLAHGAVSRLAGDHHPAKSRSAAVEEALQRGPGLVRNGLIRVEDEAPGPASGLERDVACGGEVVAPDEVQHPRSSPPCDLGSGIA